MHGRCLDNQESHGLGSRNEVLVGLTGWCRKLAAAFQDRVGIVPTGINFDGEDRLVYGDRDFLREHEDAAPSVIGAEHVAPLDGEEERPDTVYVPSERVTKRDAEVTLELRPTTGGDRALLAFTSLKELVEGCGDGQAWVAVRGEQVDDLRERSGADVVLWDAALPVEERKARFQERKR